MIEIHEIFLNINFSGHWISLNIILRIIGENIPDLSVFRSWFMFFLTRCSRHLSGEAAAELEKLPLQLSAFLFFDFKGRRFTPWDDQKIDCDDKNHLNFDVSMTWIEDGSLYTTETNWLFHVISYNRHAQTWENDTQWPYQAWKHQQILSEASACDVGLKYTVGWVNACVSHASQFVVDKKGKNGPLGA